MKNKKKLFQIIVGVLVVACGITLGVLNFCKAPSLPKSESTDIIYKAAEESGVTSREFDRKRSLAGFPGKMVVRLVDEGADPFSVVGVVLDYAAERNVGNGMFIGFSVAFICLAGIAMIGEACTASWARDSKKDRQEEKDIREYWYLKAQHLRILAAYLDEGISSSEVWKATEEDYMAWNGSDGLERFFGDKDHKLDVQDYIPRWYWEMVEGEFTIHIIKRLVEIMRKYNEDRFHAVGEFIRNVTDCDSPKDMAELRKLASALEGTDYSPLLAGKAIQTIAVDDERYPLLLSMLQTTKDWHDVLSEVDEILVETEISSETGDSPDEADGLSEEDDGNHLEDAEVCVSSGSEPAKNESVPKNKETDNHEVTVSSEELAEIDLPVIEDVPNENLGELQRRTEQERALNHILGLRSLIEGMMTDDRLTSKETTLLKAVFAEWPTDLEDDTLNMLTAPFTESKARPKVGEVRTLKKALDEIASRYEIDGVDIDETDLLEFRAFAKGITVDDTMSDDDMNAVGEWFVRHGADASEEPYASVKGMLENGDAVKVFNALKDVKGLPWD